MPDDELNPLEHAEAELRNLHRQKIELERKIDAVQQTIWILEPVYRPQVYFPGGDMPLHEAVASGLGLTDLVRNVLEKNKERELSPTDIRDALIAGGFDPTGRGNFMATIHTVLQRLYKAAEVTIAESDDRPGWKGYQWTPHPVRRPAKELPQEKRRKL